MKVRLVKTRVRNLQSLERHTGSALPQREGFSEEGWGHAQDDDGHCQVLFAVPSSSLSQYTLGRVPVKVAAKRIRFSQLGRTKVLTDVGLRLTHTHGGVKMEEITLDEM